MTDPQASSDELPEWKQALARAAELVGGWAALERLCGFSRNYFHRVMRKYKEPTLQIAMRVSAATGRKIGVQEIAPEFAKEVWREGRARRRRRRRERGREQQEEAA